MLLTADLTDVPVLVLGDPHDARRARRPEAVERELPAPATTTMPFLVRRVAACAACRS